MGRVTPWGDNGGGDTLGNGDDNGGRCDTLGEGVGSTPKGVTAEGWAGEGGGGGRGSAGAVGSPGRERVQEARERGDTNQRGWGAPRVTPGLGGVRGRRGCGGGGGSPSPGSVALVLDDDLHAVLAELRPEDQVLALQLLHLTRLGAVRLWGPVLILRQTPAPPPAPTCCRKTSLSIWSWSRPCSSSERRWLLCRSSWM